MYAAVSLFVIVCLTATTHADHHHPCHSPNMTGLMSVTSLKGETKAYGAFTFDSMGNKLRFRSNESHFMNASLELDLLVFFNEGILYEIDSKNQSCEKKVLQCSMNPFDVPNDATSFGTIFPGSPTIEGEGLKVRVWTGSMGSGHKGHYFMFVTMGCLPIGTMYFSDPTSFIISNMAIELEIKDPELLVVPSFCVGQPVEETPEGTVNSFLHEFI